MDYEFVKSRLAPCGLHCGKCFAFKEGAIVKNSRDLRQNLGNFDIYAKRFAELLNEPVFEKYPDFKEMLDYFTIAECSGCRNEKCKLFKGCNVRSCSEEKGIDFCFQCPDFPCNNTGFDEHLKERFVNINRRMGKIGVEEYYNEVVDKARY